jgi:hypothetical protein
MVVAYGRYNDLVRDVSGLRGQSVVIWDFEYVYLNWWPVRIIDLTWFSSRDSLGASVAQSKTLYNNTINSHPSTILALNHEVYGGCCRLKHSKYSLTPIRFAQRQLREHQST